MILRETDIMSFLLHQNSGDRVFDLDNTFLPAGDQPAAIEGLLAGLSEGKRNQVLLGVTGSGKTFTMANVIARSKRPALIMAHNKTLAAQLYKEMRHFFPNNAVEYFVSYYDYYQPEAYIASTDSYIEKDSQINEKIDLMRHSATRALFERPDVIIIASVSCIYGLGSAKWYEEMILHLNKSQKITRNAIMQQFINLQYKRNDFDFQRGTFRTRGDTIDLFPSHLADKAWRINMLGDSIEAIYAFDPLTGERLEALESIAVFANSHYITPSVTIQNAIKEIKADLKARLEFFRKHDKLLEAQRLEQRTNFDLEMLLETGTCKGIENYSRYLSGRAPGEAPPTLFEYLPKNALLFVDESHVTVPQVGGMFNGDRARKSNLVEYGFRLPSALDNRPLRYEEWDAMRPDTIFVSATPAELELQLVNHQVIEQVIRPTGLVDPICIVRPASGQVDDLMAECHKVIEQGLRILVTTLTKKMAEQLAAYFSEINLRAIYLHSDVKTLERIEIIENLRRGVFDILIGVNLLREGLDIPECGLVAILDADKEGFLRSRTSLIQTIGRAARNKDGRVILYADKETKALKEALEETERRRNKQLAFNQKHGVEPTTISKAITAAAAVNSPATPKQHQNPEKVLAKLRKEMLAAAKELDFEKAAMLRDEIQQIENALLL